MQALHELACDPKYFEFSANHLLTLAASELKAKIYHGSYIAFQTYSDLFSNTGAKTKANLQQRKEYLERAVKLANDAKDYYPLYILMKTLGSAANIFDMGEYDTRDDENFEAYIYFAVDTLLHYAARGDDSGLHLTAEHHILYQVRYFGITKDKTIKTNALSCQIVYKFVKKCAATLGDDFHDYSPHSLRSGFTTQALRNKARLDKITSVTLHKNLHSLDSYIKHEDRYEDHPGENFF